MADTNPINGIPFGRENSRAEYLARATWEYEQAACLRAARRPAGYRARIEAHENAAKRYERAAEGRPSSASEDHSHATRHQAAGRSSSTPENRAPATKRIAKTKLMHVVQGNYGYGNGWEDLTSEEERKEGLARLREYRENEAGVPHRLIRRRERLETGLAHATRKMFYVVTVPPTEEMGSYQTRVHGPMANARRDALWDYNSARRHDDLPPVDRMPHVTKYTKKD